GLGADRCIHLSYRAFALADTIGTSRTLALALRKEGSDLVLCGRKALDAETRQVPPEVAAFLGRPHVTYSVGLAVERDNLRVRRETDDGEETVEVPLPTVVSVTRAAREPFDSIEEAAARIRELASERPAGATAWEKPEHLAKEPGAFYDCWTLVEVSEGRATRPSLELLAKGRELSGKLGGSNVALVLGHDVAAAVEDVSRYGAEKVNVCEHE